MTTPAAMAFSGLLSTCGLLFLFWHTWHYDRWRCLVPTRQDWFRAAMCHILIASVICLMIYVWLCVHVLYSEYWIYLTILDETIVAPYQLWTTTHQNQWRAGLYFITAGWGFLQGVHLEEFLYWGYLIKSIRTPGGPKNTWLRSGFFQLWIIFFVSSFALLIGAVRIETTNLDMMKAYLFCVGSSMSVLLATASIVLCIAFPSFLKSVRKQGATVEVLDRLHFFAEMNEIRTACRVGYSVSFLILSADGLSSAKPINSNAFWADTLFLIGQSTLFASTCLSVVVLLPRNMSAESLPPDNETTFHPMVPYKRPNAEGYATKQFFELGERLNVGQDAMAAGLLSPSKNEYAYDNRASATAAGANAGANANGDVKANGGDGGGKGRVAFAPSPVPSSRGGFEMTLTPPPGTPKRSMEAPSASAGAVAGGSTQAPFSQVADRTKRARLSEVPNLPSVVSKFVSPFETSEPKVQGPTQVFVTTSQTVVEE